MPRLCICCHGPSKEQRQNTPHPMTHRMLHIISSNTESSRGFTSAPRSLGQWQADTSMMEVMPDKFTQSCAATWPTGPTSQMLERHKAAVSSAAAHSQFHSKECSMNSGSHP